MHDGISAIVECLLLAASVAHERLSWLRVLDFAPNGAAPHCFFFSLCLFCTVFGDYNMLVFRREQSAQALTDKIGASNLLTSARLPEFFNGDSAWKHGIPFLLNTHDHKLVPKPLGGERSLFSSEGVD